MNFGDVNSSIQLRSQPNDVFTTPADLAKQLIKTVPIKDGDILCDAFAGLVGQQPFFENYPNTREGFEQGNFWREIRVIDRKIGSCGGNAFHSQDMQDWIITNPPFSKINDVLEYSTWSCRKGFAYILPNHGLSYRRIKFVEERGFRIHQVISFPNPDHWNIGFSHVFVIWIRVRGMKMDQIRAPIPNRGMITIDNDSDLQTVLGDFN